MLKKTLSGRAADLLKAVDAAISAMTEPMTQMRMAAFGTKWVSDLAPRPTEAQHGDTHYASRREIDESDDLAGQSKTEPKRRFITMRE